MIRFGTSGWRGIIADDFTFENLRLASLGVADHIISRGSQNGVIIGYDTRFLSERCAEEAAFVLASKGVKSFLTDRDTPTPVISSCIIKNKLDGGINITASHNPYRYNGFKFSPAWGGPALPEDTKAIESLISGYKKPFVPSFDSVETLKSKGLCSVIDPKPDYFELLAKNVDLTGISKSGIKVYFDAIYGTGRGYVDEFLLKHGIDVETINDKRDPYFGGSGPEPSSENLSHLAELVKKSRGLSVGVATDGDADRFGIIGSDGLFIEPNKIIALLADYLARTRKYPKGMGVARSFATGSLVDMVAKKYDLKIYENPVGFKYIGKLIAENRIILGGEESAGLSIMNHVPEKDGILAALLVVEAMGKENATTNHLFEDFHKRIGHLETKRENFDVSAAVKNALPAKLGKIRGKFEGMNVGSIEKMDGTKIKFENQAWLLFRESGTEPVVRLYGEARDDAELDTIMEKGRKFLFED